MLEVKPTRSFRRPSLGEILVRSGTIDGDELEVALQRARQIRRPLGTVLVELGLATEKDVTQALSRQLNVPSMDLDSAQISADVTRWVDVELAEKFRVFPVGADPGQALLRVATSDPTNVEALETLTRRSGMMVFFFLCDETTIVRAIRRYYHRETPIQVVVPPPDPRVAELEQAVREQGIALRAMLEALDRKGLVSREELLARITPSVKRPPPLPMRRTSWRRWLPLLRDS